MANQTYQQMLRDPLWINKRREILYRDNLCCQSCGDKDGILDVHHKYYQFGRQPWEYPSEALVTLCRGCHTTEENGRKEAFKILNEEIAKAGFTREDVEKLATAFKNMTVHPIYSYLVMSGIYRGIRASFERFIGQFKNGDDSEVIFKYFADKEAMDV